VGIVADNFVVTEMVDTSNACSVADLTASAVDVENAVVVVVVDVEYYNLAGI
jgi:uncharacterized protein (UPF0179 family)